MITDFIQNEISNFTVPLQACRKVSLYPSTQFEFVICSILSASHRRISIYNLQEYLKRFDRVLIQHCVNSMFQQLGLLFCFTANFTEPIGGNISNEFNTTLFDALHPYFDINAIDKKFMTLLDHCVVLYDEPSVRFLLGRGAEPDNAKIRNSRFNSRFWITTQYLLVKTKSSSPFSRLKSEKIKSIWKLMHAESDVQRQSLFYQKMFDSVCIDDLEAIRELSKQKLFNPNCKVCMNCPLITYCESIAMTDLLINLGASLYHDTQVVLVYCRVDVGLHLIKAGMNYTQGLQELATMCKSKEKYELYYKYVESMRQNSFAMLDSRTPLCSDIAGLIVEYL